jgi:hypothetical protein
MPRSSGQFVSVISKEKHMIVELGKVSQQTKGAGEAGMELPLFPTTQPKH